MNVVFLTNIPAPYREKVHEFVDGGLEGTYTVVYCSSLESNREWTFEKGKYHKVFLESTRVTYKGRDIYLGSNILGVLGTLRPDVLIVGGFSLPMIIGCCWAVLHRKKLVSFSDANVYSERKLSIHHRVVRKIFYGVSDAYIGASKKTFDLFRGYGARDAQLFQSHLCANNEIFNDIDVRFDDREFDVILCGQMIEGKMYDFSIDVLIAIKRRRGALRVKLLGSGPLKEHILARLTDAGIDYEYPGFVDQSELPFHYSNARVFFFPTLRDAWGVVANESCAAGTPVITCPAAGAADELIVNNFNGYVEETDVEKWCELALSLLSNPLKWKCMSDNAKEAVLGYTYDNAGKGIVSAAKYVGRNV